MTTVARITLKEWARRKLHMTPHPDTLRRWVHRGDIVPQPVKMGRNYWVWPWAVHRGENERF